MSPNSGHFQIIQLLVNSTELLELDGLFVGDINLDKLGTIKKVLHVPHLMTHFISPVGILLLIVMIVSYVTRCPGGRFHRI